MTRTLTLPIEEAVAFGKVKRFLNSKARNSDATKKGYTIALAHFQIFLQKNTQHNLETILVPLEKKEIDIYTTLDDFIDYLKNRIDTYNGNTKLSEKTIAFYIAGVKSYLEYYDVEISSKKLSSEETEISGPVTYVVDGHTLDVNGIRVRLALVDTPEVGESGYESAKNFVKNLCLGNDAEVDIDDGQRGGDRYGREIGVVYCNGVNVNSELIEKKYARIYTDYCDVSEFANDNWAGCSTTNPQFNAGPVTKRSHSDSHTDNSNCDSSYPDVCIPSGPPDLDCTDIPQKRFSVPGSDPHGFDADGDGIGCES